MNYCSVTRRVSFWGVDQEVGSVSRITRRCTHAYIYMHFGWTCVWAHTCTHGITKSRVSPLLASGLSLAIFYTSQCQIIQCMLSQNEGKPTDCPRYRETFTFLATIRSRGGAGQKIQTFQKCHSFSGRGSERSARCPLAAARLCSANTSHPRADLCEPSRRLHTSTPEPAGLKASSVPLWRAQPWRTFGPVAEGRTTLPTSFSCSLPLGTLRDCGRSCCAWTQPHHTCPLVTTLFFWLFLAFYCIFKIFLSAAKLHFLRAVSLGL